MVTSEAQTTAKILIVENEVLDALALSMFLKSQGYRVCPIAVSVDQALTLAEQGAPRRHSDGHSPEQSL